MLGTILGLDAADWALIGAAAGALVAVAAAWRGVVQPMLRTLRTAAARLERIHDEVLGADGAPSLGERLAGVEVRLAQHLEAHGETSSNGAAPSPVPRPSVRR